MSNFDAKTLDYIKLNQSLSSDAKLAGFIGISQASITMVRKGERKLGWVQRLKVGDKAGFLVLRGLAEAIVPANFAERIRAFGAKRADDIAIKNLLDKPDLLTDSEVIDIFKATYPFPLDKDMAKFLKVSEAYVSQVRKGKAKLSNVVKLRILNSVLAKEKGKTFDLDAVMEICSNPKLFFEKLKQLKKDVN